MHARGNDLLLGAGLLAAVVMTGAPWLLNQSPPLCAEPPRRESLDAHNDVDPPRKANATHDSFAAGDSEIIPEERLSEVDDGVEPDDAIATNDAIEPDDAIGANDAPQAPEELAATRRGLFLESYDETSQVNVEWSGEETTNWFRSRPPRSGEPLLQATGPIELHTVRTSSIPVDTAQRDPAGDFLKPIAESAAQVDPAKLEWSRAHIIAGGGNEPNTPQTQSSNPDGAAPDCPPGYYLPQDVAPANAGDEEIGLAMAEWTGTEIIAWVGAEPIVSGELLPQINEIIERSKVQIPPERLGAMRAKLLRNFLKPLIETKLLFNAAKSLSPKKGSLSMVQAQLDAMFENEFVPSMIAEAKLDTREELDQKLRANGSSLDVKRLAFFERGIAMLARMRFSEAVKSLLAKEEFGITEQQLLGVYNAHVADYETPPRARWEQIRVRFDMHETREEARQLLSDWESDLQEGASLTLLAEALTEDRFAPDGLHDWTNQGSIASKELDEAIFTLPVGELSPIIEDERGLSIIRVVEREDLTRKPFSEVAAEIKQKLEEDRTEAEIDHFMQSLRVGATIRTIFDDPTMLPVATRPADASQ